MVKGEATGHGRLPHPLPLSFFEGEGRPAGQQRARVSADGGAGYPAVPNFTAVPETETMSMVPRMDS